MAIVHESVVVAGVAALPSQNHSVVVAVIAVNHIIIRIHSCRVGDAEGAVGIAGINHLAAGIDAAAGVDFPQT